MTISATTALDSATVPLPPELWGNRELPGQDKYPAGPTRADIYEEAN